MRSSCPAFPIGGRLIFFAVVFVLLSASVEAAPNPAAVAAILAGEPVPLGSRTGGVFAGRRASSNFAWRDLPGGWQVMEDANVTAWRRGGGPVELLRVDAPGVDEATLKISGPAGFLRSGDEPPLVLWKLEQPGVVLSQDGRLYRFKAGDPQLQLPLAETGSEAVFDLRDMQKEVAATLLAEGSLAAARLVAPFYATDRPAGTAFRRQFIATFAQRAARELIATAGDDAWMNHEYECSQIAQTFLRDPVETIMEATRTAIREEATRLGGWPAAYAKTYWPDGDAKFSREAMTNVLNDLRVIVHGTGSGPFAAYTRNLLQSLPAGPLLEPISATVHQPKLMRFLKAAQTADDPATSMLELAAAGALIAQAPGAKDQVPILGAMVGQRLATTAAEFEARKLPATAASYYLYAHLMVSPVVAGTSDLASAAAGKDGSYVGQARRVLAPLAAEIWPALDPGDKESARLLQLLQRAPDFAGIPLQAVLGLRPGEGNAYLGAVRKLKPGVVPVVLSGGVPSFKFTKPAEAKPVNWRMTFTNTGYIDPNDPAAKQMAVIRGIEQNLTRLKRNGQGWAGQAAEAECEVAVLFQVRDGLGAAHLHSTDRLSREADRLQESGFLLNVTDGSTATGQQARQNLERARVEYEAENKQSRADSENLRGWWNRVDARIAELQRLIQENRRAIASDANPGAIAALERELAAELAKLPAATTVAERVKRYGAICGRDDERLDPLRAHFTQAPRARLAALEGTGLAKGSPEEREIQWLIWWLNLEDKKYEPLPKEIQPLTVWCAEVAAEVFNHLVDGALAEANPVEKLKQAVWMVALHSYRDNWNQVLEPGLRRFIRETAKGNAADVYARIPEFARKGVKITLNSPDADAVLASFSPEERKLLEPIFAAAAVQ